MSEDKVQQMASHPGIEYLRELLESNPPHPRKDEFIPWLVEPFHNELERGVDQLPIRSSVMLVVTTDGKILSRGRAWNQFTKYGCGGGKWPKGLIGLSYSCREAVYDEFGISPHNPAILEVSPPVLWVCDKCSTSKGDPCTIVWVQFMLLDHVQVVKLTEKPLWDQPTTPGEWGYYSVGGEALKSPECGRQRRLQYRADVPFCLDFIEDLPITADQYYDRWGWRYDVWWSS